MSQTHASLSAAAASKARAALCLLLSVLLALFLVPVYQGQASAASPTTANTAAAASTVSGNAELNPLAGETLTQSLALRYKVGTSASKAAKTFTPDEMVNMAQPGTIGYSSHSGKGYYLRVATQYVTVADFLAAAGFNFTNGDSISCGERTYSYSDYVATTRNYYPNWMSGSAQGATQVPFAIALQSYAGYPQEDDYTAGDDAVDAYAKKADYSRAYCICFGQTSPTESTGPMLIHSASSITVNVSSDDAVEPFIKQELTSAIDAATAAKEGVAISDSGDGLAAGTTYVTQAEATAFDSAISTAQTAANSDSLTNGTASSAATAITAATTVYNAAKKTASGVTQPTSIAGATIAAIPDQTYTGSALEPAVTVTLNGATLTSGTDYTVAYANNTNVGTAQVVVTGKGNYTGLCSTTFKIVAASSGDGGGSGSGDGGGSTTRTSILGATISAIPDQTYTGSALEPDVVVTLNGTTLTAGTDYTLTYANNINVGTAQVLITGKGNYIGVRTATFKIVAASSGGGGNSGDGGNSGNNGGNSGGNTGGNSGNNGGNSGGNGGKTSLPTSILGATISAIPDQTYTGSALEPAVTVTLNGTTLTAGTDYTVVYANNINVGTAEVVVTGKGNYIGVLPATFKIVAANSGDNNGGNSGNNGSNNGGNSGGDNNGGNSGNNGGNSGNNGNNGGNSGGSDNNGNNSGGSDNNGSSTSVSAKRLAGDSRYDTMSAIVSEGFTSGSCETAVLAAGKDFPDALTASALAGAFKAPVILTETDHLSSQAKSEIERLGVKTVLVLGGSNSINDGVLTEVQGLNGSITTQRIAGDSRQATSALAFAKVVLENPTCDTVIIAAGKTFPDTLSISPYAYDKKTPILLTDNDGKLTTEEIVALKAALTVRNVIIVGGTNSVSSQVQSQLESKVTGISYKFTRLSGNDRYETSAEIAKWELTQGMSAESTAIATGANFPDALAGAALSGVKGGILLLASDGNSDKACSVLSEHKAAVKSFYVYGGTNSVSEGTVNTCEEALK